MRYYATAKRADGLTDVFTNDAHAFQAIVGWASGSHGQVHADFYGQRSLNYTAPGLIPRTKGRMQPGDSAWCWHFGADHARVLLAYVEAHRDDPKYYSKAEVRRLDNLVEVLLSLAEGV